MSNWCVCFHGGKGNKNVIYADTEMITPTDQRLPSLRDPWALSLESVLINSLISEQYLA